MGSVLYFPFDESSQSHGGAGGWPSANLTQKLIFWVQAPRPQGSLEAMGNGLFVEALKSHENQQGRPGRWGTTCPPRINA
ncbi:hypothetical protein TRICI_001853 [Trichomonascus ciferrii]|uniref:Uncharacterized protein n=1 Tax=Trichomonascus ciferrii TaxID=44093 RepID=A0A642V871_9ASCO|nr:hypothetical protein TRICI_001853 [Trichomonascus ciferrii]